MLQITVSGLDEAISAMDRLPAECRERVFGPALVAAAEPVERQAKANIHSRTHQLERSIETTRPKLRPGETIAVFIIAGLRWYVGQTFYGAMIEWGWQVGKRLASTTLKGRIKNRLRRRIPGQRFMERAADAKGHEAIDIATKLIEDGVVREFNRA